MAAVEVTISGVLFDKLNRTTQNVVLIGEASLTGVGVGGGPIVPPGQPPGIWGGSNEPFPTPPIANVPGAPGYRPPGIWGGSNEGFPTPPIYLPPQLPPGAIPPDPPNPGDPTTPLPPPAIVVQYPGVGKVLVPLPATAG